MPENTAAVAAVAELNQSVVALAEAFEHTDRFAKRTRTIAIGLGVAGAVATIGALAGAVAIANSDDAKDRAEFLSVYLTDSCRSANESRKAQRELWSYIIDFSVDNAKRPPTNTEKTQLEELRRYINKSFSDRDCTKVGR